MANSEASSNPHFKFFTPQSFTPQSFTPQSFGTFGGCLVAAGVGATTICGVFKLDPKIVGLSVSIFVAYVALFIGKKPSLVDYIIAGFNGFLIYLTLVGATSFSPYVNSQTAVGADTSKAQTLSSTILSPWVRDPNLVKANRSLLEVNHQQALALKAVNANVATLHSRVEKLSIPASLKYEIARGLATNKALIEATSNNVAEDITTLQKLGIMY